MAPTALLFVSQPMADAYHREWREIGRRYPALSDPPDGVPHAEHWENLAQLRAAARDELRQALRQAAAQGHDGPIPIPI